MDQVAMVSRIASNNQEPARQEFLGAGSRLVCTHGAAHYAKLDFQPVVKEHRQYYLKLMEADVTVVYGILNGSSFGSKLNLALKTNFGQAKERSSSSLQS